MIYTAPFMDCKIIAAVHENHLWDPSTSLHKILKSEKNYPKPQKIALE